MVLGKKCCNGEILPGCMVFFYIHAQKRGNVLRTSQWTKKMSSFKRLHEELGNVMFGLFFAC